LADNLSARHGDLTAAIPESSRDSSCMNYFYNMVNGGRIEFRNEGNQTFVSVSSRGAGQQQSQGSGFSTGAWSKEPSLFGLQNELILEIHTQEGSRFLRVNANQIRSMDNPPELGNAKQLPLEKSSEESGMKLMKPMEPMKPMAPMKPMRPMGT
jgi:hypothetical protein